jgi:hypothetical protein
VLVASACVAVGAGQLAAGATASLVAVGIGCGMGENGEEVVLLPLPPAAAADRAIMLAVIGIDSASRCVDSNTDRLIMRLVTQRGIRAEQNVNFGGCVETALLRPTAGRTRPCLHVDQVTEGKWGGVCRIHISPIPAGIRCRIHSHTAVRTSNR